MLDRVYQHAVDFPASALAVAVAHLPPREFFADAAVVSLPKGEPSNAGWDYTAFVMFLSIFLLGVVLGIILRLVAQWIFGLG